MLTRTRQVLAILILPLALIALFPNDAAIVILTFLKPMPLAFSLIPALSLVIRDGFSPVKEAFCGRNPELAGKLQKRLLVFGFAAFLICGSHILHSLELTDEIGPKVMFWARISLFLGFQSWLLS